MRSMFIRGRRRRTPRRFRTFAPAWGLPVLFCGPAFAQSEPPVQTLDRIVVTGTRSEASIASIPASVQIIGGDDIRQQHNAGRQVADIISTLVPGVSPAPGTMTNFSQTMRGRSMLILIDGVSQNTSRDNARQLNSIAQESIERIEVLSGASSIYGAGATGGIINIITKRNQGQDLAFVSRIGLTAGHRFRGDGLAQEYFQSATGRSQAIDWYLSANLIQRGSQYDSAGRRIPPETNQSSKMDTRTYDLHGRFGWQLGQSQRLTLGLQRYLDRQDSAYGYQIENGQAVARKGLMLDEQPRTENQAVNLNFSHDDWFGQQLALESYWRTHFARFYPDRPRRLAGLAATSSRAKVSGIRAAITTPLDGLLDDASLTWGADYDRELIWQTAKQYTTEGLRYTPTGVVFQLGPEALTQTRALFLQTAVPLGNWTLRGGVRRQWMRTDLEDSVAYGDIQATGVGGILPGGRLNYSATLYNLGIVRHLTANQDVFASFSQGFTLPDLIRFLRDTPSTFDVRTLSKQPLKTDSYEIGWRGSWERLSASLSVYHNNSSLTQYYDAIVRTLRLRPQRERVRGLEGSLEYAGDHWRIGGSYTYTKGETRDAGQWRALPATRISPPKTTLYIGYTDQGYSAQLQMQRVGNYTAAMRDQNGRAISGYTVFDLLASAPLPRGNLDFAIHNLFNRKYDTVYMQASARAPWPNTPGRTVSLSYRLSW